MKELLVEVQASVFMEYNRAAEKFGKANSSPHESYAVILEEFEEATDASGTFSALLKNYWFAVKGNNLQIQPTFLCDMREFAINAAAEWIQVAAMCYKAQQSKEGAECGK